MATPLDNTKVEAVARVARAGLDAEGLFQETRPRLRRSVPFDAACWHTLDPSTLLETRTRECYCGQALSNRFDIRLGILLRYAHRRRYA